MSLDLSPFERGAGNAVAQFWATRTDAARQQASGNAGPTVRSRVPS